MSGDDAPAGAETTYEASSFEPTPGYTQTRYDPGTMSRTDVDVVMEDIEQQLSLRPADERANRARDRKLLCMSAMLVAVAVSVGVTVSKKNKVETEAKVSLAAPPDYITSVCSPDMIALGSGRDKCEELCEVAVCCFVPETDKVSCVEDNEDVCREYVAVCGNLDAETEQKPEDSGGSGGGTDTDGGADQPDDTTDAVGEGDEVETAETNKEDEGTESTASGEEQSNEPPAEIDDLKAAIDSSCKEDVISSAGGTAACEALCGPGSCCFSSGGQSCESEGSNVDCGEYSACAVIFTSDSAPVAEATKEEVDAKCKGDVTKTPEGLEKCQIICEQAACCFAHGDEYCLSAGLDVDCIHFSSCAVLHRGEYDDLDDDDETDDTDTDTDTPTATTTTAAAVTTTTTTTTTTESVQTDDTAASEGGTAADDNTSGGTIQTKAQIDEACLQDLTDHDWKMTCETLCLAGKCCFDTPEPSCEDNNGQGEIINCADFGSCSRVFQDGVQQDSAKEILAEACSEASLAAPGGEIACKEACEGSECCFSDPNTCSSIDCNDYSICSAVMGDATKDTEETGVQPKEAEDETPKEGDGNEAAAEEKAAEDEDTALATAEKVIEKCSSEKLESELGRAECEKLCINHLCCFATENDCKEALGTECLEYAACEALVEWGNEP